MRQKLVEVLRDIDEYIIIFGDFSTPLSEMDRSSRQKISNDPNEINIAIDHLAVMDIHGLFHLTADKHSSQVHMEH